MDPQDEVVRAITTSCTTKQGTICRGWVVLCNSIFKRMLHTCKMNVATAAIAARVEVMDTPHASEEAYACGSRRQAIKVLLWEIRQNLDEDERAQYTPMAVLLFAVRESYAIPEVQQFAFAVLKDLTTTSTTREFDVPSLQYSCRESPDATARANTASFVAADGVVLMVVMANMMLEEAVSGTLGQCLLVLYNACAHGGGAIVADIKDTDLVELLVETISLLNDVHDIHGARWQTEERAASMAGVPLLVEERGTCDSLLVICYRLLFLLSHDKLLGHEYMQQNGCIEDICAQLRRQSIFPVPALQADIILPHPVVVELCCRTLYRLCQQSSAHTLAVSDRDNVQLLLRVLHQTREYPDAVESITCLLQLIVFTDRRTTSMVVEMDGLDILQNLLQHAPHFRTVYGPKQSPITHGRIVKILIAVCLDDHRQANLLARGDIVPCIMYYITIYPNNGDFLKYAGCLLRQIADHGPRAFMSAGTQRMMHTGSPLGIMLAVIKRRQHDVPVQEVFYETLLRLCVDNPEARSRIVKLDAVQGAIATLTVHHSNLAIVSVVVRLLQQLAADGGFSRYSANVMPTLRFVMDAAGLAIPAIQKTIMDALPAMCDADPAGLDPVLWYTRHLSISSLVLRNMHRYKNHPTLSAAACSPILYMFNRHNKTENTAALRLNFKLTAIPQIMHIMHIAQNWDRLMVRRQFQEVLWQFAVDDQERVCVDSVAGREEAVQHMLDKYKIGFRSLLTFQDAFATATTNTEFQDDIADDAFEHWFEGLGGRFACDVPFVEGFASTDHSHEL